MSTVTPHAEEIEQLIGGATAPALIASDETVEDPGVIIALDDDQRIRRALAMTPNIGFYRYQVSFKLLKA